MAYLRVVPLLLGIAGVFLLALPNLVHAYIDPGSGSYLIQFILALLLGGAFAVKRFWHNIKKTSRDMFGRQGKEHNKWR